MFDQWHARWRCLRGKHEPVRNKVRRNGLIYVGTCRACGVAITKRNGTAWKADPR